MKVDSRLSSAIGAAVVDDENRVDPPQGPSTVLGERKFPPRLPSPSSSRPLLEVYGIEPTEEGVFMARWFGVGLLANGLTTFLARNAAESEAGRAIALALAVSYGVGVVLALWGTLTGLFNALGWIAHTISCIANVSRATTSSRRTAWR